MNTLRDCWEAIVEHKAVLLFSLVIGIGGGTWLFVMDELNQQNCRERRASLPCDSYIWNEEENSCNLASLPDGPCAYSDPCMLTCSCKNGLVEGEERDCTLFEDPCKYRYCWSNESEWECRDGNMIYGDGFIAHGDRGNPDGYKDNGSRCMGSAGEEGACARGLCIAEDGRVVAPRPSAWKALKAKGQ